MGRLRPLESRHAIQRHTLKWLRRRERQGGETLDHDDRCVDSDFDRDHGVRRDRPGRHSNRVLGSDRLRETAQKLGLVQIAQVHDERRPQNMVSRRLSPIVVMVRPGLRSFTEVRPCPAHGSPNRRRVRRGLAQGRSARWNLSLATVVGACGVAGLPRHASEIDLDGDALLHRDLYDCRGDCKVLKANAGAVEKGDLIV